jgi:hypothetical protein
VGAPQYINISLGVGMGETVQAILVAPTSAAVVGLPAMADVMERARKDFEDAGIPFEVEEVREGEHRLILSPFPRPDKPRGTVDGDRWTRTQIYGAANKCPPRRNCPQPSP